ncbi:hypothetical protein P8452_38046 [Trifolium repens]|nr:hypothetical protein P8452_38046 [Trifolium repens]
MEPKEVRVMREILASEPKAIFHVVHYGNQVCAEVDPSFVLQFWNELRSFWHIMDYVGIYNIICRSTLPSETTWFDITLTDTMINKTKFLLPQSFGEYIRFYGFDELKVCTDDERANKFWVFSKDTPTFKTKIGFFLGINTTIYYNHSKLCNWQSFNFNIHFRIILIFLYFLASLTASSTSSDKTDPEYREYLANHHVDEDNAIPFWEYQIAEKLSNYLDIPEMHNLCRFMFVIRMMGK